MTDNGCFNWDDTIENDGNGFVLLDEGDYTFTVTGFERGSYPGGAKIPPCNVAKLTLTVDTAASSTQIKCDLLLYKSLEWKISSFFRSIGMKKHGERLVMNWNGILGESGMAHIGQREYTGNDGQVRKTNEVKYFMDPLPESMKRSNLNDPEDIPF